MQVQINKPVTLGKNTYGKGQHTLPAEDAKGWFFEALVNEGSIVVLRSDEAPAPAPEPVAAPQYAEMDETAEEYCAILDGSTRQIADAIADLPLEKLQELHAAETAGKTRKSVIRLLEEAIGSR